MASSLPKMNVSSSSRGDALPVQLGLIVVVDGRELELVGREDGQERVDPRAARADLEREVLGDRPLDHERAVDEIELHEAVVPVAARVARLDLDDAAETAAMIDAVAAGKELQPRDDLAVHGRAQPTEVKQRWNEDAVDVGARVLRRRAPHDEQAAAEGRARDAGEVLHRLERVALGAGDVAQLVAGERLLHGFDDGALRAHRRGVALAAEHIPGGRERLTGW